VPATPMNNIARFSSQYSPMNFDPTSKKIIPVQSFSNAYETTLEKDISEDDKRVSSIAGGYDAPPVKKPLIPENSDLSKVLNTQTTPNDSEMVPAADLSLKNRTLSNDNPVRTSIARLSSAHKVSLTEKSNKTEASLKRHSTRNSSI